VAPPPPFVEFEPPPQPATNATTNAALTTNENAPTEIAATASPENPATSRTHDAVDVAGLLRCLCARSMTLLQ